MVVISGLAVTATVIVCSPDFVDDELEQAATVIVTAAAAAITIGHRRRRRALARIMCSSCYELCSDADVPSGVGR
jgi:hypothetical protein